MSATDLRTFLDAAPAVALIEVVQAKGSTPREAGAWMLVSPSAILGTIGGGQLEFLAIGKARELIRENIAAGALDIPLGPEIGQCCGGRVELAISLLDADRRRELDRRANEEDTRRPYVFVFGAGHVGHALADALTLMPLVVTVVETRADALEGIAVAARKLLTSLPEDVVRMAPAGSAFVVLTHDHALDFLIVAEALKRGDAAYVGMIGSKTKKATFKNWYLKEANGTAAALARLVCPIGGAGVRDKRPPVIAALVAAEIATALLRP